MKKSFIKLMLRALLISLATVPATLLYPAAASAACPTNSASLGQVTGTFTASASGTYRIWSRIMPDSGNAANNSYSLEIDDVYCDVTVGDSVIPNNTWTWVDYKDANTTSKININLTSGTHTFKLYGREAGVKLDRIIFAADTACVPSGTGDNCASPTAPPPVTEVPAFVPGTYNDTELTYTGTWTAGSNSTLYQQNDHYTNIDGSTATFKATGTGIKLYAAKDYPHGIMAVSIDGGPDVDVDLYSAVRQDAKVFERLDLSDSTHTVVLKHTGRKNAQSAGTFVLIDRVDVIAASIPIPPVTPPVTPPADVTPPVINFTFPNITAPIPPSGVVTTISSIIFRPTITDAGGLKSQSLKLNNNDITLTSGQYETPRVNGNYTFSASATDNADLTSTRTQTIKLRNPDINRNGKVDTYDVLTVLRGFNGTEKAYDFNADDTVSTYDVLFVLRNWTQ